MQILIGALGTTAFFLCLFVAYTIGRRHNKTAIAEQLTEQEAEEQELQIKGFDNIMHYDYDVAIGRRAK